MRKARTVTESDVLMNSMNFKNSMNMMNFKLFWLVTVSVQYFRTRKKTEKQKS